MSKKLDRNKLTTMIISGVLVAGAGTYAFAAQYNQPQMALDNASSVVSSEAVSSTVSSTIESVAPVESVQSIAESIVESSAPKEEIKTESTVIPAETQASVSQPEQTSASSAPEVNASSSYVVSLVPDVCYYSIVDPETGKFVDVYSSRYNDLKKQLGGDAGTVPTDQSVACQAALAQYKAKQASSTASTK